MAKRPSLDIALGSPDIEAFKSKLNDASSHVGTVARQVAKRFLDMNDTIKDSMLASASSMALGFAGKALLIVGSLKLMSDAIGATRDQLKEMVAIADKAENLGVSPQFLQAFTGEARKLKIEAGELESALSSAFNATKDRSPISIAEWETGKEKISDVEKTLRVLNATVAGGKLEGLVLFRDADTQEKKVIAVLKAMQQLEQIGQRAAALDLGSQMFGSQFVDRIRQGKTSADSMLATMQKLSVESGDIFPNDLMVRAKQIDDQLKLAHERLSTALKPAFNDLADGMLVIKDYWKDVVDLIGQAVDWTNRLGLTSETMRKKNELASINDAIKNGTGLGGAPQATMIPGVSKLYDAIGAEKPQDALRRRRDNLQGEIDAAERQANVFPEQPKPSRGTGAAPTRKPTAEAGVDKLETATDGIAKRTAALQAEAGAIDLGTAAREKAKVTAQLETIAKQANAGAGKGENLVTAEQRKLIDDVAAGYANAALAIEKARVASSIKFGRATAMLDPSDVAIAERLRDIYPDVATALGSVEAAAMRSNEAMKGIANTLSSSLSSNLTDIAMNSKSVGQGFADMSQVAIRAINEMIFKMLIVQPLMRGLQGGLGFADGGAVALPGSADFIGPVLRAGGGMINGPGTGTSDSIPARLSDGEFVVNASATAKNRALLEAINSGSLRGFATGGLVSDVPTPSGAPMIGGQTVNNNVSVNVNGSAGTPAQNNDLAAKIGQQVQDAARAMVAKELRTQMRPNGILSR